MVPARATIAVLVICLLAAHPLGITSLRSTRPLYAANVGVHDSLSSTPPLKVLLVVEPTPFSYVSGYANRFKEMLGNLKAAGDHVQVVTPDPDPRHPREYFGYPITSPKGFSLPLYKQVTLSLDFAGNIPKILKLFKPDLLHVSSPSCLLFPSIVWAKWLKVPLVMSYHTDIAAYAKSYLPWMPNVIEAFAHWLVRTLHSFADLTLCTSPQLRKELLGLGVPRVDVWQKGINTEVRQ
jgi:sulfoquinovosyltransferase